MRPLNQKLQLKNEATEIIGEIIAIHPVGQASRVESEYTINFGGHKMRLKNSVISELFETPVVSRSDSTTKPIEKDEVTTIPEKKTSKKGRKKNASS